MNQDILEIANKIVYHNVMQHGSEATASQVLSMPKEVNSMLAWLEQVKQQSVTFI
jgi:hypothetical protein